MEPSGEMTYTSSPNRRSERQPRVDGAGELPRTLGSVGRTETRHASPAYAGVRKRGIQ